MSQWIVKFRQMMKVIDEAICLNKQGEYRQAILILSSLLESAIEDYSTKGIHVIFSHITMNYVELEEYVFCIPFSSHLWHDE